MVGLGEEPPNRQRWWHPEPKAPEETEEQKRKRLAADAPTPYSPKVCVKLCVKIVLLLPLLVLTASQAAKLCMGDFVSAFAHPPFRWLFITMVWTWTHTISYLSCVHACVAMMQQCNRAYL